MNNNMGPENNNIYRVKTVNNMSTLALFLGITSLFLFSTIIIPILLGSFGIIIAILSKEKELKMNGPAKIGFISSILGIIAAIILTVNTVYLLKHDPAYRQEVSHTFEKVYGMTLDEYLDTYGGEYNFLK